MMRPALSPRERAVLLCMVEGLGEKATALRLQISVYTVKEYRASLYRKLEVRNATEAVRVARQQLLIPVAGASPLCA
ncbi:response regulator transcription factor [Leeia aquatica]|uniref:Response regulator transcription factor n=1 Tax=Leeia aquatica TaxID=2725557 RepID=A0A847S363_9NEIS|nr:LuxR C-terminal-related transcriptional regulator [Leeia aquatica]NLR74233.1 response regulator transcription factor [Leeia aquatica]